MIRSRMYFALELTLFALILILFSNSARSGHQCAVLESDAQVITDLKISEVTNNGLMPTLMGSKLIGPDKAKNMHDT